MSVVFDTVFGEVYEKAYVIDHDDPYHSKTFSSTFERAFKMIISMHRPFAFPKSDNAYPLVLLKTIYNEDMTCVEIHNHSEVASRWSFVRILYRRIGTIIVNIRWVKRQIHHLLTTS